MRWLLTPRWIIAHVVVLILAVVFVNLGFWQLSRLGERRLTNTVAETRFESEPTEVTALVQAAGGDLESLEYRRATATGVFRPEDEVLIRSQVHQGVAGFHVITPLVGVGGSAILVDRGWIPLVLDQVPVAEAPPPDGTVRVEGWVRLTQLRGALGPRDPDTGRLATMSRVDIDRIDEQVPYELEPVYLSLLGADSDELPVAAPPPSFDEEGSHLAYAIQWFSFALIGLVGYFFLIKRSARRSH